MKLNLLLMQVIILFCCFVAAAKAEDQPQRIVSLGSYITEGLFLLGVEDKIVGVTTYCNRPEAAKKKEKAGSIVDVSIEKIISLNPDVILTTPLTNEKAKGKLKQMGMKVVEFEQVRDFQQICQQFLKLGRLVHKERQAQKIVDRAKEKAHNIQMKIANMPLKKVFIQVGTRPLFTMNKEFFLNDLIKRAGGINIAENTATGIYSREKVVEKNPDVIIIAGMGLVAEDEKKIWMRYSTINAVKTNSVYSMDPDIICNPLPKNFVNTLEVVAKLLHKDRLEGEDAQ